MAKYTDAQLKAIAAALPEAYLDTDGHFTKTAQRLNLTRMQLVALCGQSALVAEALQNAKDELADEIESVVQGAARRPDKYRGVNVTGALFFLKCRRPLEWQDRQTVVHEEADGYRRARQDDADDKAVSQLTVVNGGAPLDAGGTRE